MRLRLIHVVGMLERPPLFLNGLDERSEDDMRPDRLGGVDAPVVDPVVAKLSAGGSLHLSPEVRVEGSRNDPGSLLGQGRDGVGDAAQVRRVE